MKFYIATNSHDRLHRNWFGRTTYQLQLLSICVISERGDVFYAISDDVNTRIMSRGEAHERVSEMADFGSEWNIMPLRELRTRLKNVIYDELRRVSTKVEFIGYNCSKDFTLLASLYGGKDHPEYPSFFPERIIDLEQSIHHHINTMGDEEFDLGTTYGLFIKKEIPNTMYTHDEKMEMFATHFLYPKPNIKGNPLVNRTWHIKRLAEFLTKVKCYSSEELHALQENPFQ